MVTPTKQPLPIFAGPFGRIANGIQFVFSRIQRLPQDAPRFFSWFWTNQRHWIFPLIPFLFLIFRTFHSAWSTWFSFDSPVTIQAFVPLLALNLGWVRRHEIATAYNEFTQMVSPNSKRRHGQVWIVLLGVLVLLMASIAIVPLLSVLALIILIAGVIYYIYGWFVFGLLAVPLIFLLFMILPEILLILPEMVGHSAASFLQKINAEVVAGALKPILQGVKSGGNIISLPNTRLIVTPSLAGLNVLVPVFVLTIWIAVRRRVRYFNYPVLVLLVLVIGLLVNFVRLFLLSLIINSNPSLRTASLVGNSLWLNPWLLVLIALIPGYYLVKMFQPKTLSQLGEGENTR